MSDEMYTMLATSLEQTTNEASDWLSTYRNVSSSKECCTGIETSPEVFFDIDKWSERGWMDRCMVR